jgi:hypothetical protein
MFLYADRLTANEVRKNFLEKAKERKDKKKENCNYTQECPRAK